MKKTTYPVIFTETKDCTLIDVPDLKILSEGTDIENAIEMARDAIGLNLVSREDNKEPIPNPSKVSDISIKNGAFYSEGESFVSIVDIDVEKYRKQIETKPVRRNVSLPSWLNEAADASGVNVSGILQEALIKKLNLINKFQ